MDPLSIAAGASTLAAFGLKVSTLLYGFLTDSHNIDTNVKALCEEVTNLSRIADAISKSWKQDTLIAAAEAGPHGNLWASVKAALEDCQGTLEQLLRKLNEVQKSNFVGRGILRRPVKNIKFNMKSKDILTFQQRIHSHSIAMQGGLQMIHLCLLLSGNSSLEEVVRVLSGLQDQVCQMESALQSRDDSLSPDEQQEENRIDRNLKQLVRAAKSLHSDANTVIITGAGSSVWGGSIMGEPLSQDIFNQIEAWIPPPSHEEPERQDGLSPRPTSPSPAIWPDSSDSESDIEKDIMKKFEELAAAKFATKDYEKAATLLRKLVDYSFRDGKSQEEITKIEIKLACVYSLQSKWQEAEAITVRATGSAGNDEVDKVLFHVLHALALLYLQENNFELARKHCKGAIKGKRKLLGRTHASSYESIALLACIYDATGDSAEAEGCRSLLPDDYSKDVDLQPVSYMSVNVPSIGISSAEAANTSAIRPSPITQGVLLAQSDTTVNQSAVLDIPNSETSAHHSTTPSMKAAGVMVELPVSLAVQRDSEVSVVDVPSTETTLPGHNWLASQAAHPLDTPREDVSKPQIIESTSKVGLDKQLDADQETSACTTLPDPTLESKKSSTKWGGREITQTERHMTRVLVLVKHLLETLTRWSQGQADADEVSDIYVRLGNEFNLLCRYLTSLGIETSDLGPVPDALRTILEETLEQPASRQSLDRYLPGVRDVVIPLLQGLMRKKRLLDGHTRKDNSSDSSARSAGNETKSLDTQESIP